MTRTTIPLHEQLDEAIRQDLARVDIGDRVAQLSLWEQAKLHAAFQREVTRAGWVAPKAATR
jgi:hypothetical protein